jgi:two-component system, OmpR family, sensor kinase
MALVLAATGVFLYLSFKADLNQSLDRGLRTRASDVSALVEQADNGLRESKTGRLTRGSDSFAQILVRNGRVLDATRQAGTKPLLNSSELARAKQGTISVDHPAEGRSNEPTRLLATPVSAQEQQVVVVVGSSLEHRNDALAKLQGLLMLGGFGALLLSSLLGYGVAAAALRPVESMRRRAATISGAHAGKRLPVSPARDELGRLGDTLNEMLARLEAALEHERGFVADASHELRTPLATMRTELELALRRGRSVGELQAALRSATDETDQLCRLAEDLLVLARSDQGRLPVRREDLRVVEVLRRVRDRFGARARSSGREIRIESHERLFVRADPIRLEQALSNMTDNALRHGAGTVILSASVNGDRTRIQVSDQGDGFQADFVPKAFERFSRADSARPRGGAGLGLAIVSTIARSHGGEAGASNGPGIGAIVSLDLPNESNGSRGDTP